MSTDPTPNLEDAARLIGHEFARPELLAEALTHPSALGAPKQGRRRMRRGARPRNYERLEFLGDRVLGLVIAHLLWHRFENEPEGPLTRRHAQLVRRDTLAQVAAEIGLGRYVRVSPAEDAAGAARNPGILADVMEAVIAAIYLDAGFATAFVFVERLLGPLLAGMAAPPRDPKTVLQEWVQARGLPLPLYETQSMSGPDHARQFTVAVHVKDQDAASATASSKRSAEAAAAAELLRRLAAADHARKASRNAA